jgi:hypothetical protein
MIETTVSQRRELDSERQQKETEDQRRVREVRHPAVSPQSHTRLPFIPSLARSLFRTYTGYSCTSRSCTS